MKRNRFPKPIPPPDGFVLRRGRSGELEEMDIKMVQEFSKYCLRTNDDPEWKRDPSYFWRKKR